MEKIGWKNGRLVVPDNPIIPVIIGDGVGIDIMPVVLNIMDIAVSKAYKNKRSIKWFEIPAGRSAKEKLGDPLPDESLRIIKNHHIAIKGPLETDVGTGYRSLNVRIRQKLDLFACIRPIRYIKGVMSPVKRPDKLDIIIFRENTEDVYAGYEWNEGSKEAMTLVDNLNVFFGTKLPKHTGVGIKPISKRNSQRLIRTAFDYAIKNDRKSITLVHKGNIMKFTEGAFRDWGYELSRKEYKGKIGPGKRIDLKEVIADSMFQQLLMRPEEYDVIATTNLNGDYLSDAAAAQVGGLGMVPSSNVGEKVAVFEATHGTAPKHAGKDKVNPSSLLLAGCMMLDHIGWGEVSSIIRKALEKTIIQKTVTYDLYRQIDGGKLLKCSEFGDAIIRNMKK